MESNIPDEKRIVDMTAGELRRLFAEVGGVQRTRRILRGYAGMMEIFHCSRSKARQIKESGVIDSAITQEGAGYSFLVDGDEALRLYKRWCG